MILMRRACTYAWFSGLHMHGHHDRELHGDGACGIGIYPGLGPPPRPSQCGSWPSPAPRGPQFVSPSNAHLPAGLRMREILPTYAFAASPMRERPACLQAQPPAAEGPHAQCAAALVPAALERTMQVGSKGPSRSWYETLQTE